MQYVHGGDVYGYAAQYPGQNVLDFSANINPRGIPEAVRQAMLDAVEQCAQYPDPFCRALTNALAQTYGLPPETFFCANGAAEVFYRLADVLRPQTALVTAPTFAEYEAALTHFGCKVRHHTLTGTGKLCRYSAHSGRTGRRGCVHPVQSEQSHWPDD